ncbi:hypothetical protein ACQ4PT_048235 [Festuca glaucescens]
MNLKIVTDEAKGKGKGKKSAPQKKQITRWLPPKRQRIMMLQPIRHELLAEMVWEILIRLPVESLARFKLVSKPWQAIISNPVFIRAHLQCSKQKQQRSPSSFLIVPQIYLGPNPSITFSTNIRFYKWSLQQDDMKMRRSSSSIATLHYGRHFPAGEFELVSQMAHCDGLVLLPTNSNTYIFNPATRDAISLPESQHNVLQHCTCLPIGFGLDASTGKYKVARSFYRAFDYDSISMGMEVFTINGQDRSWTASSMDPPYLILCPQTAIYCKGCLFYFIDKEKQPCSPRGLIRFSLEDETFGITPLLNNVFPIVEDEDIVLHELDGELCATFFCKSMQRLFVCMTRDIIDPEWHICYIINVSTRCQPMASLSNAGILIRQNNYLFRCYKEAHSITHSVNEDGIFDIDGLRFLGPTEDTLGHAWEDLCWFDLLPYTESLVPVNHKASLHAS